MNMLFWIYAARPKTLVASIVPVVSAILILPDKNIFKLDIFIFTIIAAMIIQIVTNYVNDLYDFLKGAERYKFDLGGKPQQLYDIKLNKI